jgi:hypothetical protein
MYRSFAATSASNAFHTARLQKQADVSGAMFNLKEQANKGSGDLTDKTNVYNEMARRHVLDMQYKPTPWISTASHLTFVHKLALTPGFVLMQMAQGPMLTLPMLAARHGVIQSGRAMARALADTGSLMKASVIESRNERGGAAGILRYALNIDKHVERMPGERDMLRRLFNNGQIDIGLPNDLMEAAHGAINPKMRTALRVLSWAPQQVEISNRVTAALAAYRMESAKAKAKGTEALQAKTEALAYAERVVDNTHFDYNPSSRAYHMRPGATLGSAAKLIFQFKNYQQGIIYLMLHNFKQAFLRPGLTAEEKSEGRRTLLGLLTTHSLMTGLSGLPIAFPLGMMAKLVVASGLYGALGGDDEDRKLGLSFNYENELRDFLTDHFGHDAATAMSKGILSLIGIDLSKKLGVGDVFDPFAYMRTPATGSGRGYVAEGMLTLLGPTAGILADAADGVNLMMQGNLLKGFEKACPTG